MAFTFRNKRFGYDNIASGSATGQEHIVVAGNVTASGDCTTRPSKDAGGNTSTSVLAIGRRENLIRLPSSDDNTQEESTITTNTSYTGQTSGTSATSVFYEGLGSSNVFGNVS